MRELRIPLAVLAAVIAVLFTLVTRADSGSPFVEQHRAEAEAHCQVEPEMRFRKYLNADGTDPAPDMDAFEYCVAAYISHLPRG